METALPNHVELAMALIYLLGEISAWGSARNQPQNSGTATPPQQPKTLQITPISITITNVNLSFLFSTKLTSAQPCWFLVVDLTTQHDHEMPPAAWPQMCINAFNISAIHDFWLQLHTKLPRAETKAWTNQQIDFCAICQPCSPPMATNTLQPVLFTAVGKMRGS